MKIDEARHDQPPGGVNRPQPALDRDLSVNGLDDAPADPDIAPAPQGLAGIDEVASLDDEIEFVGRAHRRMGRP